MRRRILPEAGLLLSWLSAVLLCCSIRPCHAFIHTSPWTPGSITASSPAATQSIFNRMCSSFAFHDEPARSPVPLPDLNGIRDAIRVGDVIDAFQDMSRIRSVGETIPQGVYEELLLRCANVKRPPWLQVCREALELYLVDARELGLKPSSQVLRTVLTATTKGGDVHGSVMLLRLMATHQPQVLSEYHFFLVLNCCAQAKRMSVAETVLKQMDELSIRRSVYIYSALFKGYGKQGWAREVEALVDELLRQEVVKPDVVLMNTAVDALVRVGDAKQARQILTDMTQGQQPEEPMSRRLPVPDLCTYNTVLKGLSEAGDLSAAMDLYRGMQRAGVVPDSITVNTLVTAAVSTGNLVQAAQLLRSTSTPASVEGYSALLEGFVRRGDLEKANDVLKDMKALGVSPNVQTYTSLLKGASNTGDVGQMMNIFQAMIAQGEKEPLVRPNVWTYNTVIAGLIRGEQLDAALNIWADLKQPQERAGAPTVRPDVVTVNTLLDGLLRHDPPRVREAEALFIEMMEAGTPQPDEYTFSILLRAYEPETDLSPQQQQYAGLVLNGGPSRLLDMMMRNRDLCLDNTAVNTLLLALTRARNWKRSMVLFDDFKAGHLTRGRPGRPDVITYTILIKGVSESNNMYAGVKIMQLYREMRQTYKVRPDRRLINAMVNSVAGARSRLGGMEMEDLEEVFDDLRRLGWSEAQIDALEQQSWSYSALYSEAWKDDQSPWNNNKPQSSNNRGRRNGGGGGRKQQPPPEDPLFKKYGWNQIDSGFGPL